VASVPPAPAAPRTGGIWRGGGGGLQGGRGGITGEAVPMDTADPKYVDYMKLVRERIYANWAYPFEAMRRQQTGELLIDFGIAKDGRLVFIELRRTSGVNILDEYALNAVKLGNPYPPVPDTIGDKNGLPIAGTFVYHLTSPLDRLILR
jgi:TonB family protein